MKTNSRNSKKDGPKTKCMPRGAKEASAVYYYIDFGRQILATLNVDVIYTDRDKFVFWITLLDRLRARDHAIPHQCLGSIIAILSRALAWGFA